LIGGAARLVGGTSVASRTELRKTFAETSGVTATELRRPRLTADTYTYDAWGNLTYPYHQGDTQQPYQYVGQLGYYTHYQDANMGLLQLGVRFYDPGTGRFGQRDPKALDTVADMCYSNNNPMSGVDPDGMKCRPCNKGGRLNKCWPMLDKGAGGFPFYGRGKARVGINIRMCDGDGRFLGFGEKLDATTYCWPVKHHGKTDWECQIDFYEDMIKSTDICCTLLHEIMHAANWPMSNKKVDKDYCFVNSYLGLYQYKCDPCSPCYGNPWTPPAGGKYLK